MNKNDNHRYMINSIGKKLDCFYYVLDKSKCKLEIVEFKSIISIDEDDDKVKIAVNNSVNNGSIQIEIALKAVEDLINIGPCCLDVIQKLKELRNEALKTLPEECVLLQNLLFEASCCGRWLGKTNFVISNKYKNKPVFLVSSPCPIANVYTEPYLTFNKDAYCFNYLSISMEGIYDLILYTNDEVYKFKAIYINGGFKLNRNFSMNEDYLMIKRMLNVNTSNQEELIDKLRKREKYEVLIDYYNYID